VNSSAISLDRLKELSVPIEWHEAVAVADAIAALARPAGTVGSTNCVLSVQGAVQISGTAVTPWDKPTIGALQLLLEPTRAPRELVALIESGQELPDAEVADRLRFFARPDAPAVIGQLAARAIQTDKDQAAQRVFAKLRSDATAALSPDKKKNVSVNQPRVSRRVAAGAGAVTILVLLTVLARTFPGWRVPSRAISVAAVAASATEAVGNVTTTVDSLVDSGLRSLGLGSVGDPAVSTSPAAAPPTTSKQPSRRVLPSTSVSARAAVSVPAPVLQVSPVAESRPTGAPDVNNDLVVDSHVYTSANVEVEPPALVRPQLPTPATRRSANEATHIEVHVNTEGQVEKVRLYPDGSTLNDRMLVSAAKAWVFRPALKEGHPVNYTLLVPLTR
jgi:hypothetical protein